MQGEAFVIGAIGNFSGWRHPEALEEHRSRARFFDIDRDNLDAVLSRLAPRIQLDLPFCRTLRLSSWGDFHPDGLVERVPALQKLLEARENVGNPPLMRRCLEQAGVDFDPVSGRGDADDGRVAPPEPTARSMGDGDLLDSMLGGSPGEGAAPRSPSTYGDGSAGDSGTGSFDRLIREIVDSSGDGTDYAQQDRWRAAIDAELSERMRSLLWHPEFRRLEASWSALRDLVRHSDTGEGLRIRVLDFAREDLLAELAELGETPKLEGSTLYRLIAESEPGLPGERPFDLLVTDFRVDLEPESLRLLTYLLRLCEQTQVPLLAAAVGQAGDIREASERELQAWIDLQGHPGASRIGLCTPEILLRPPYGPETEPIESFAFDEDARAGQPEAYAWGTASFAVARAVTRAYEEDGDLADLARHTELESLPIHVYREDGEVQQRGPAREIMTEPRLEACQLMGLIPVVTPRGRDSLRIVSLRSLGGSSLFAGS